MKSSEALGRVLKNRSCIDYREKYMIIFIITWIQIGLGALFEHDNIEKKRQKHCCEDVFFFKYELKITVVSCNSPC